LDEQLCLRDDFTRITDPGREDCGAGKFSRQRTQQLCALDWYDLRALPYADLGFTFGYDLGGLSTRYQNGLRL
jgi:hypothetical protein